jgi:tRNA A37 threonylcarbamoyladenosine biosynthesis protein TsaE
MEVVTKNAKETFELGRKTGSSLVGGEILAFTGGLGAGISVCVSAICELEVGIAAGVSVAKL